MVAISVEIPKAQQRELVRHMDNVERQLPRAMSTAVRRTVRNVRVELTDAVFKDLNVKKSDLYQRNNPQRPITEWLKREGGLVTGGGVKAGSGDIGHDRLGGRIPLSRFGATQLKRAGVAYKIKRGGSRKKAGGAFKATMRSGHEGVFRRVGRSRLPVTELHGPSVGHVAERLPRVKRLARGGAGNMLERNVEQQIARFAE